MRLRVDVDVEMKTRDGVILRADVYRPDITAPVPAIVCRTPYDKARRPHLDYLPPRVAAAAGFSFVFQDIRGRYASDGEWVAVASEHEMADGYDTIEWVASEPWCDGNVGMVGASYESFTQFMTMLAGPPALKAIAPQSSGHTPRGIVMLNCLVSWGAKTAQEWLVRHPVGGDDQTRYEDMLDQAMRDPNAVAAHLPVAELPLASMPIPNNPFKVFFEAAEMGQLGFVPAGAFNVPSLWTSGYYDMSLGAVKQFEAIRACAATEAARTESKLILGPWHHEHLEANIGEVFFGLNTMPVEAGVQDAHLRFFSRHLRGDDIEGLPNAKYFVMGTNEWRADEAWPPPAVEARSLYLHSGGHANTSAGDGHLTSVPGGADEPSDEYFYDPARPVPSYGGAFYWGDGGQPFGPLDQARIETRDDVLTYTSDTLTDALTIAGDVELELYVSSSAPDTDFIAKLCDVDTAGVSLNLADGICRTRWRSAGDEPDPALIPGESCRLLIELGPVGHCFRDGHRIRVQLTSSCFPWYDRNMNTGGRLGADAEGPVATQTVHHDTARPSRLLLPVQPTGTRGRDSAPGCGLGPTSSGLLDSCLAEATLEQVSGVVDDLEHPVRIELASP